MQVRGSVVLLTGASRGIGAATARALTDAGATVVGTGRSVAPAGWPLDAGWVPAELRETGSAERIVEQALARHGRIDALIANAGVGHAGPLARMPADRIAELVEVNVAAPLLLTRAVLPSMLEAGRGNLLFVSSIAGALGVPGEAVYSATKAAVESFADTLRQELHGRGITVATLLPGVVATDFHAARGQPYARRVPRPVPPDRLARVLLDMLERDRIRVFRPRWLAGPAALRASAPRLYRALERRFG